MWPWEPKVQTEKREARRYHVEWHFEILAESPEEAARVAANAAQANCQDDYFAFRVEQRDDSPGYRKGQMIVEAAPSNRLDKLPAQLTCEEPWKMNPEVAR